MGRGKEGKKTEAPTFLFRSAHCQRTGLLSFPSQRTRMSETQAFVLDSSDNLEWSSGHTLSDLLQTSQSECSEGSSLALTGVDQHDPYGGWDSDGLSSIPGSGNEFDDDLGMEEAFALLASHSSTTLSTINAYGGNPQQVDQPSSATKMGSEGSRRGSRSRGRGRGSRRRRRRGGSRGKSVARRRRELAEAIVAWEAAIESAPGLTESTRSRLRQHVAILLKQLQRRYGFY